MTRSQAVTLPARDALAALAAAYTEIERVTTPDDAAALADHTRIIAAAVRASDQSRDAQNAAARLHLTAERRLGQLLAEAVTPGSTDPDKTLPEGVSRVRSSHAQKLAAIPDEDWNRWIDTTTSAGREVTKAAALRLAPTTKRTPSRSLADTYAAPALDTSIVRAIGLDAADTRADMILAQLQTGLADLAKKNPRQAFVWARYHGINDDGTEGDSWTYDAIAQQNGWSRPYVESQYYRACAYLYGLAWRCTLEVVAILHAERAA